MSELINSPGQENGETAHGQDNTAKEDVSAESRLEVAPQISPTPLHTEKSHQCRYAPTPKWKTNLEALALFAAIIYAVVAYCQWREMHHSLLVDQRAWMIPTESHFSQLEINKIVKIESTIHNNGHTPAINVTADGNCDYWQDRPTPPMDKFPKAVSGAPIVTGPGAGFAFSCQTLIAKDQSTLDQIENGQIHTRIYATIWYEDIFGHHHWAMFCATYEELSRKFISCPDGNHIDTDQE